MGSFVGAIVSSIAPVLLFSFFEMKWGQSPGKKIVGIVALDVDQYPLSPSRALLRNFSKWVFSAPTFIGLLVALFTQQKQTLHDLIAKSVVVDRDEISGVAAFFRSFGAGFVLMLVFVSFSYMNKDMIASRKKPEAASNKSLAESMADLEKSNVEMKKLLADLEARKKARQEKANAAPGTAAATSTCDSGESGVKAHKSAFGLKFKISQHPLLPGLPL
jgi:hypothetical protein